MKYLPFYISFFLLLTTFSLSILFQKERQERIRIEGNQTSLLNGIKHYKTKAGLDAVTIQTLNLTKKELKEHEQDLVSTIQKQGIKIKRLESVTQIKTETKIEFQANKKDSSIYIPEKDSTINFTLLEYKNSYFSFTGSFQNEKLLAKIIIPVDIDIYGHRVPKQFWFIKYGVRSVDLEVISLNPYTTINYARNIKLQK